MPTLNLQGLSTDQLHDVESRFNQRRVPVRLFLIIGQGLDLYCSGYICKRLSYKYGCVCIAFIIFTPKQQS